MFEEAPAEVCVLRLSAIGDCCHALPVVRTLQAAWPETRFTWIIGAPEASLVGDIPDIEFIVFDKSGGLESVRRLRSALRGRRFDLLLHMHPSMRANLVSLAVSAKIRLGFDRARAKDCQGLFTNCRIESKDRQHVMDDLFGFAQAVGVCHRVLRWDIPLSDADRAFAAEQSGEGQPLLVLSPCSSARRGRRENFRNWRPEHYAAVADHAAAKHGARVVLTGDASEAAHAFTRPVLDEAREVIVDLVGKTSLKRLLALLERASALVCSDSGPVHMGTAVGTPVVGLYASTNPNRAGPYANIEYTVNKYAEAVMREYGLRVEDLPWGTRVHDPSAMELILVEEVCRQVDRVFEGGRDGGSASKATA